MRVNNTSARLSSSTVYIAGYALCTLICGYLSNFFISQNDFWGHLFIAEHLDPHTPASLYNGFFRLFVDETPALIAMVLLSVFPRWFHYISGAGADAGAALFFFLGASILMQSVLEGEKSVLRIGLAGVCFGAGALWRYHIFIAGGIAVFLIWIFNPRSWKMQAIAGITMLAAYSPQIIINLINGHGPFETAHELAIYDCMYSANWHRISDIHLISSMLQTILADPGRFISRYSLGVARQFAISLPFIAGLFILRDNRLQRLNRILLMIGGLYAIAFGFSVSSRVPIPLIPFAVFITTAICFELRGRITALRPSMRQTATLLLAAVIAAQALFFVYKDMRKLLFRNQQARTFRQIESILVQSGVRDSRQVFTSDWDFYFRGLGPHRPLFNGGWGRMATYRWPEEYPELPVDTAALFITDCVRRGVRYVLLTPADAAELSADMRKLYDGAIMDPRMRYITAIRDFRIFRIEPYDQHPN